MNLFAMSITKPVLDRRCVDAISDPFKQTYFDVLHLQTYPPRDTSLKIVTLSYYLNLTANGQINVIQYANWIDKAHTLFST